PLPLRPAAAAPTPPLLHLPLRLSYQHTLLRARVGRHSAHLDAGVGVGRGDLRGRLQALVAELSTMVVDRPVPGDRLGRGTLRPRTDRWYPPGHVDPRPGRRCALQCRRRGLRPEVARPRSSLVRLPRDLPLADHRGVRLPLHRGVVRRVHRLLTEQDHHDAGGKVTPTTSSSLPCQGEVQPFRAALRKLTDSSAPRLPWCGRSYRPAGSSAPEDSTKS